MIRSFANDKTENLWSGRRVRGLPPDIQNRALKRLRVLNRARTLEDLRNPPGNRLHALKDDRAGQHSISIICNGVYASSGETEARTVSRSQTITNAEWLHNPHAGEMLASEFMEPLGIDAEALGMALDIPADHIRSVISGSQVLDAELDLCLSRYFRMSEGFFLGLQTDYELMQAKRALNGALDRIIPRAA